MLPFLIVSPVVIGVSWLVLIWFVRQLYYEFGYVPAIPCNSTSVRN